MYPRLYMHTLQHVSYHAKTKQVIFETRLVTGRRFHFVLTKDQFYSFNDAILLIDKLKFHGHFPLGNNTWFNYNAFNVSLYKETNDQKRVEFIFVSYEEYKRVTHKRLLSLIRLKEKDVERKKNEERDGHKRKIDFTSYQRSLSIVQQSTDRSPSPKRPRGEEWEAASGPTDDAILSCGKEENTIFSEWKSSTPRRRNDSISSNSTLSKNLPSPSTVQLCDPDSDESMEIE